MENSEIARIFHEIADLLEVKGDNPFRVRSYRNAALVVEGLPESLRTLALKGDEGLMHIPGIGESIREKILEMTRTGRCTFHDGLLKEVPQGILGILKVSGVGPRKAAVFFKELGITDVEGLEKAAKTQRLRTLTGFGEKSEERILKAIKDLRSMSGRANLGAALQYAGAFQAYLKKIPGVTDCLPAGSLRRWKDSIGDIDILAACDEKAAAAVMDRFAAYTDVRDVVSRGVTKSTVMLKAGLQVDLRVMEKKSFGAALQYFTGSKAHNIALRDRAKRMGLKISEYGVFKEKSGAWVAGETEEDVYRSVGLPWIPPELRENRGEIEAAEEGRLPEMLDVKDIRGDLHVHTSESDGSYSLEDMADGAISRGYAYMAVTDHSKAVGIAHGLDEKRVLAQIKRIDEFNGKLKKRGIKFTVLRGAEVDIRADGSLDHPDSVLDKLDCVVAAVHSGFSMSMSDMTERILKGIRSGKINVLAHPTGRLISSREPYAVDMEKVMDEARKYGVALELNSYPDRLDLNDIHLALAREKGVPVVISTDAHSIHHFDNILYGVHTARRGWLEKKDVLNTRPLKELMKLLKRK